MKKILYFVILFFSASTIQAQLYQQQFGSALATFNNTNTTDVNYVCPGTPTCTSTSNSQATWISSNSASATIGVASGLMTWVRPGSGTLLFVRNANMVVTGGSAPTSLMMRFDYNVSAAGGTSSAAITFFAGSGFANTNTTPSTAHSSFNLAISSTTGPAWKVNNTGTAYTGQKTVLWVVNNSGATLKYKSPAGTEESVANDTYDIWVGTTKEQDDIAAASAATAIQNFAFRTPGGNGTHTFDNFLVDPIPAKPTSNAATLVNGTDFTANWTAVNDVTGYRIDVATDAAFTSMVSGYNNLYVSGQATNSLLVTGLSPLTTYYYRVRAVGQYTVDEFAGENSASQTLTTTAGSTPTLTVTPASLSAFSQNIGTPSATQTYTVSGINLTGNATLAPSSNNFEISNDGGTTWYNNTTPLTLTNNGSGGITGQPVSIQVRMNAAASGAYAGTLSHTSTGATAVNISLSGTAVATYYNNNSGSLDQLTSWGISSNGSGANPSSFSNNFQVFIAQNNGTATFAAPAGISGTNSKLVIGDGTNPMNVTIPASSAFTGVVDVQNNATLTIQNTTNPTFGTLATGSTVVFDGAGVTTTAGVSYGNLSLLNTGNFSTGITGIRGVFSPGSGNGPAATGSIVNFNGTSAQTIPSFVYDSLQINNTAGVSTAGSGTVIQTNKGLKVSQNLTIAAGDSVKLSGTNFSSIVIDATRSVTTNGLLVLKTTIAPVLTGTLTVNNGGKYIVDANVGNVTGVIPAATYNSGSEILVLQGAPRLPATIGGNVTWSSSGSGSYLNSASNTISGNLTLTAGQINHGTGGTSRSLTVGGDLNIQGGRYDVLGAPGSGSTGQSLTVNGNVNVTGGKLFASAGTGGTGVGTITIKGNINHTSGAIGDSNIVNTTGLFILNGTSAQTISTTGLSDTFNLTVNNPTGVSLLSGNVDLMNGVLTLTSGKISLGNNDLSIGSQSGGNNTNYIVTNGTGNLIIKNLAPSTSTTFPVGSSTSSYNPVTLATNAGHTTDNFSVRVANGVLNAGTTGTAFTTDWVDRGWFISEGTPGGSDVNLTVQWTATQELSGFDRNNCTISHWDGIAWDDLAGAAATGADPYSISRNNVSSFSPFGVQRHQTPTPLTLLSFNGILNNGLAKLNWTSTNEINVKHFVVEKSTDGSNFNGIGTVNAANTAGTNMYNFTDPVSISGVAYYRLKMVDLDGKFRYSIVIALNSKKAGNLAAFPNPVSDQLFVTHAKATAGATISIFAMDGRKVAAETVAKDAVQQTINTSRLTAGIYQLVFQNGDSVEHIRFVKQ